MKINIPMNVSPTRANVPAKSAGQSDPDAIGLFSIQMNKILSQSDEKNGVGGGYSQSGNDESGDDASGSMYRTNAHEIESNVTVRDIRNQRTDVDSKEDAGDKRGSSEAGMKDGSSGVNGGAETGKSVNSPGQFEESARDKTENEEKKKFDVPASKETDTKTPNGPDGKTAISLQKGEEPGMISGTAGTRADADTKLQNSRTPDLSTEWTEKGQRAADSTPGSNPAEEIPVSDGSGRIQKNLTESDLATSRAGREGSFTVPSQSSGSGRTEAGISGNTESDSSLFNSREDLNASEGGSGQKREIQALNTGHGNRVTSPLESGTAGGKQIPVADPLNRQDAAERNGFARMSDFAGEETSIKTSAEETPSNGNRGESGDDSRQAATAKTFQVDGNVSQTAAGRDAIQVKSFQTELSGHASAGPVHVSGSNAPAGPNMARPMAPQSNEFLSQVTERIHFLIRDGGDAIRIRLQPDEFGHMEIRAESTARGMAVRISAETGSIKSILENNLHILQHNLQELGLKVDRIQVMLQDFFDSQSNSGHFSKSGNSNSGQYEKGSRRNFGGNGNSPEDAVHDNDDEAVYIPDARFHTVA
jgi:flagellar hook-length control protein FliK